MPLIPKNQPPYYDTTNVLPDGIKRYIALLNQTGTDAPIPIILQNTIGEITFQYISAGKYNITGPIGSFKLEKTQIFTQEGNAQVVKFKVGSEEETDEFIKRNSYQ